MKFSAVEGLIPTLITRLEPVEDLGLTVQGLPNKRSEIGFKASDSVTLAWIAWSPIQGQGNAIRGLVTETITLNARISASTLSRRNQAADLIVSLLSGWEVTGLPGQFFSYGGAEIIPPAENDSDYRMDVRFALVVQSKPVKA